MWDAIKQFFSGVIDFVVGIFNWFFGGIAEYIFQWLSLWGLDISIPINVYDILNELTIGVGYIFPVRALLPIPLLMISFYLLKLVFAVYHLIAGTIIKRVKLKL